METEIKVVQGKWSVFGRRHDDVFMTVSFDDDATFTPLPHLNLCARVIIPILETKPNSSFPIDVESETLFAMEDQITGALQDKQISCRLVAGLTYEGLRELVFQVEDKDAFRSLVGSWMKAHPSYKISVSEHEGWDFFDDYIRLTDSERRHIAEGRVIDNLIKNGSDPSLPNDLGYCFEGKKRVLRKVARQLAKKGYQEVGLDFENEQITFSISMPLDRGCIKAESDANEELANDSGASLNGLGCVNRDGSLKSFTPRQQTMRSVPYRRRKPR